VRITPRELVMDTFALSTPLELVDRFTIRR
jgi:hypothetical protein